MKKGKQMVFALVMAVSLLFTGIPAAASESGKGAAPQSETEAGVEVVYNQTDARKMLERINSFRTGDDAWAWNESDTEKVYYEGLGELVYDYELEKVAMQRAAELIAAYSHTRPDGSSCFSAYGSGFNGAKGENIAASLSGASEWQAFLMWKEDNFPYSGQGHRRNMLNGDFRAVGIAHVEYEGCTYWVQEFSGNIVSAAETEPADGLENVKVKIANDRISARTLEPAKSSVRIKIGESAPAPQAHVALRTVDTWGSAPSLLVSDAVLAQWEVPAGETLVSLSADGSLQALAAGKTMVKAVYDGMEADVSVVVTEDAPPQADADKTTYATIDGGRQGMYDASRDLTVAVFGRATCSNTRNTLKRLDDLGLPDDQADICYIDIMQAGREEVGVLAAQMATAGVAYCYDPGNTANDALWNYAQTYLGENDGYRVYNLPICVFTDASGNVQKVTEGPQGAASLKKLIESVGCGDLLKDDSANPSIKGLTVEFSSAMHYTGKYWPLKVKGTLESDIVEYALAGDDPVYDTVMKKLGHAGTYHVICRVRREGYQTWIRTVTVTVAQSEPEYEIPEGLEGKSGTALADIALPERFSWKDPATVLQRVGAHSYTAVYTPKNTKDYRTVEVELTIQVACPGHKFSSVIIRKPGKISGGMERLTCDYCGYSYLNFIPKISEGSSDTRPDGDGQMENGGQSAGGKVSAPAKAKLKSAKRSGGTKVKLSWKKVSGASGYEIYMKAGKGKYKKIKSLGKTKTSYTKTGLKRKTSYTFRIRAYKKSGNTKVCGAYSNTKKVK